MTSQDRMDNAFDLLRDLPAEVSMEDVSLMVAAFPAVPPASHWYQNLNLNTIIMTTAGTLIVAGLTYFLASGSPQQPVIAVVAPTIENTAVPVEEPAEAMAMPSPSALVETLPTVIEPASIIDPNVEVLNEPVEAVTEEATVMEPIVEPIAVVDPLSEPPVASPSPAIQPRSDKERPATVKRTFDLSGFNSIGAKGSINVVVSQGPFSVTAEGDSDIVNNLELVVKGNTLEVSKGDRKKKGKKNNYNYYSSCSCESFVSITMPDLKAVSIGGSGTVDIKDFALSGPMSLAVAGSGDIHFTSFTGLADLKISVAGSGDVSGDKVEVSGRTKISVAGSGDVRVAGTSTEVEIGISGSGDVDANELESNNAKVSIAGSGDVSVNTNGTLTKAVSGSGKVCNTGSGGKDPRSEDADEQ